MYKLQIYKIEIYVERKNEYGNWYDSRKGLRETFYTEKDLGEIEKALIKKLDLEKNERPVILKIETVYGGIL